MLGNNTVSRHAGRFLPACLEVGLCLELRRCLEVGRGFIPGVKQQNQRGLQALRHAFADLAVICSTVSHEEPGISKEIKVFNRIATCLALALIATTALVAGPEKPASLTLKDLHGAKARLSDYKGKIVVVNFWATWCGPCDAEMPMLVKTASSYAGKNVAFIGVSVDEPDTQTKIPAYLAKRQVEYPIWTGATDDDMKHLQLGKAVPATLFLDANGIVKARILGQMRPGEIEQRVDWLLNNEQGTAPPQVVEHLEGK